MSEDPHGESGQALLESAIAVPLLLFLFLCLLQIMMIAHTRVMLDYAAFNAARAGVVHNGNTAVMRNAALLSLLPTFAAAKGGASQSKWGRVISTWAKMKAWAMIAEPIDSGVASVENYLSDATGGKVSFAGAIPDLNVVSVQILNPGPGAFKADALNPTDQEIDFDLAARMEGKADSVMDDDKASLKRTQLTIRVIYLYQLRVPLADRFLFYGYMATAYLNAALQTPKYSNWWSTKDAEAKVDRASFATAIDLSVFGNGFAAYTHEQLMFQALRQLPSFGSYYFMPLQAVHTMPMESNLFRRHLNE
jgi:TadE-like protein